MGMHYATTEHDVQANVCGLMQPGKAYIEIT